MKEAKLYVIVNGDNKFYRNARDFSADLSKAKLFKTAGPAKGIRTKIINMIVRRVRGNKVYISPSWKMPITVKTVTITLDE